MLSMHLAARLRFLLNRWIDWRGIVMWLALVDISSGDQTRRRWVKSGWNSAPRIAWIARASLVAP